MKAMMHGNYDTLTVPTMPKAISPAGGSVVLARAALLAGVTPTPSERRVGRLLRAPEGHEGADGGGDGGGDAGATAGAAGAGGEGDGGAAAAAAAGAEGADGTGSIAGDIGAAAAAEKKEGEEGAGDGAGGEKKEGEEGAEAGAAKIEVLGAPEAYTIELPAEFTEGGGTLDKEAFDLVEPVLRELNLSNEAANALTAAYTTKVLPLLEKRAGERQDAVGAQMRKDWEAASRADATIGGERFDQTKAEVKQLFTKAGVSPDFLKVLDDSGLGNHPDMLRTLAFLGRKVGEAKVDPGGSEQAAVRLADRVYGKAEPRS